MATNEKSSAVLTDAEIKTSLECCKIAVFQKDCLNLNCPFATKYGCNIRQADLRNEALNLINRKEEMIEALIAGQETLQKALAEKNAEIDNQSQNLKVLVSDHRTLQQSFDNLKGLYEAEKAKVEKANEKCIGFAKELQTANAEIERLKNECFCIANERDAIGDCLNIAVEEAKAEAVKECLDWVLSLFPEDKNFTTISRFTVKQKLKEMVGDADV